MFQSQSSDHHQESITVLVQLLLIGVHASSYSGMWLYVVCACDVPVRVVSGYVLYTTPTGTSYAQMRLCIRCTCPFGVWLCTVHHTDRYIICTDASVHTMYLSMWCLVMYCRLYPVEVERVRIVGWDRLPT